MKKIIVLLFVIAVISSSPAYGHKLITHDDTHRNLENALEIPDHKISWAIYENLGPNEKKFYSFEAEPGDSFYASIVIPKIVGLEEYSPTLVLINGNYIEKDRALLDGQAVMEKVVYDGEFPGSEFYEPFGQVTYWERQEVKTTLTTEGKYFVIVLDEKNQAGKYSLAIGTIEDFSGADLLTVLPTAWLETKLFVGDYASVAIFILVLIAILVTSIIIVIRRKLTR
ncbi:MAG: hypothetical protein GKS07_10830 [Nitrosopumilus sp.]|nr:MAG: hypothetical protein GKS07_10830 [Nitrosopumilus sp.]